MRCLSRLTPPSAGIPYWVLARVLAAPLPVKLPDCGLGKQRMVQVLGTLHSMRDLEEAPDFELAQVWLLQPFAK